jgi:hypothetical protein
MVAIPLFLLPVELRLFSFRLKFMYLNGVAVEVKWEIDFDKFELKLFFPPMHHLRVNIFICSENSLLFVSAV